MSPEEVIAQLQGLAAGSQQAFQRGALKVANEIAVTAIGLAPEDTGKLIGSIDVVENEQGISVEVGAPYAAYVEFGTGGDASSYVPTLPQEWQDEAEQFLVNGEGKTGQHPFLYPAVLRHIEELPEAVDEEIQKLL